MPMAYERVALVTGSSRGLGAAIARRLAQDGFAVAVNGQRGDEQAGEVGRSIRDGGGAADVFYADVTDEQQAGELVAAITGRLGPVDVLVLNATGPQPEAPVTEVTWADHVAQLDFFAHAVSFFASERAGFITGQRIVVDGGRDLGT
jgi:3-oxoacyl-[acyl-carrier protein] reductase